MLISTPADPGIGTQSGHRRRSLSGGSEKT
jgi:hypothetical protein